MPAASSPATRFRALRLGGHLLLLASIAMPWSPSLAQENLDAAEESLQAADECDQLEPDQVRLGVTTEARRQGLDPKLAIVVAQIGGEFGRAEAGGVMQLTASMASRYNVSDICDFQQNVRAGVSVLKDLTRKYRGNMLLVLAAYHAGDESVKAARGVPARQETVRFVAAAVNALYDLSASIAADGQLAPDVQRRTPNAQRHAQKDHDGSPGRGPKWIAGSVLYLDND